MAKIQFEAPIICCFIPWLQAGRRYTLFSIFLCWKIHFYLWCLMFSGISVFWGKWYIFCWQCCCFRSEAPLKVEIQSWYETSNILANVLGLSIGQLSGHTYIYVCMYKPAVTRSKLNWFTHYTKLSPTHCWSILGVDTKHCRATWEFV